MKNRVSFAGILLAAAFAAAGCTGEKHNTEKATSGETSPLVALCSGIDCSDTASLHSEPVMKRTMAEIVRLMEATDSAATHEALSLLFGKLRKDEEGLKEATRHADLFLNSPASPMRDETLYIRLLRTLLSTDSLPEGVRLRAEEQLRTASLNRPGSIATDFRYLDRSGSEGSLHQFGTPQTLLIFYDPECPHCPEILTQIASHPGINKAIGAGELGVLAIYAEGKRDVWDKTKAEMPGNWTVGYDLTGILDKELYDLPAMPILYILDREKRVVLKDPDPTSLLR